MYILICSDAETIDGNKEAAINVAKARLQAGKWPIYKGTRNRTRINLGDECLVYLAGKKELAQHIFAKCKVARKRESKPLEQIDSKDWLIDVPFQVLELEGVCLLEPIPIRLFLGKLSFLKSKKWGAAFQGGCRHVTHDDVAILETKIKPKQAHTKP